MRINKLFILLLFSCSAFAQTDVFRFINSGALEQYNGVQLQASGAMISNAVNTGMVNDYLFGSQFAANHVDQFRALTDRRLFLDGQTALNLSFYHSDTNSTFRIQFRRAQETYLRTNKQLADWAFFGNANYAGKTVSSGSTGFLSFSRTDMIYHAKLLRRKTFDMDLQFGLVFLEKIQALSANDVSLFTDDEDVSIDAQLGDVRYIYPDVGRNAVGANLGLRMQYRLNNKHHLHMSVRDLALIGLLKRQEIRLDTAMDFDGFDLSWGDLINGRMGRSLDSSVRSALDTVDGQSFMTLPTKLDLGYVYTLSDQHLFGLDVRSVFYKGLAVQLALSHTAKFNANWRLRSALAYGNNAGFFWSEAVEFRTGSWNIFSSIIGLNSLLSDRFTTYGVSVGLAKAL